MIRPLDLQTMYMNLYKLGKEQAHNRDNVHNQQLAEAQKLSQEDELMRHSVNKAETGAQTTDGNRNKVKADARGNGGKRQLLQGEKPETDNEEEPAEGFKDPRLGKHIDLTG
jgi:hypothetical protein